MVDGTELSPKGYGISKDTLSDKLVDELKKELTFTPRLPTSISNGSVPATIRVYRENSKKIYIPKAFGLQRFGPPARNTMDDGTPIAVEFQGQLNIDQANVARAFINCANDPSRMGGILNLPCGFGKTVVALYAIAELGVKTLIVVHKDFLLDQWRSRIAEFLGGNIRIGTIKAKIIDVDNKDIVIASLQSLSMKQYPQAIFEGIGLVVVDEVHRTGTEVFSRALSKTNTKYSLGLSATVQRKDGMSKVFTYFLGDVISRIKRGKEHVKVTMHEFYNPSPEYSSEHYIYGTRLNISRMVNQICCYEPRTSMICDYIKGAVAQGRKILVLSDRKSQLADLRNAIANDATCGLYIGGMSKDALSQTERCQVILATYSFASEGFDVKTLDTLVLASPRTDIEQSVGRILRLREGERQNVPVIYDIVDSFSVFESQANKRSKFYKRHGYMVERFGGVRIDQPTMESCQGYMFADQDDGTTSNTTHG